MQGLCGTSNPAQINPRIEIWTSVSGLPLYDYDNRICESCVFGKHHRNSLKARSWRASQPLELVHADICGPMQTLSLNKSRSHLC